MNILLVYAHNSPNSYGSALHNRMLGYLERQGHTVVVSDLYGEGFQPIDAAWDFAQSVGPHANYQDQQANAANNGGFSSEIQREIDRVRASETVIFEFPLWWSAPPAIMKGWLDKVFALGVAWDTQARYGSGLLRGKQAGLVVTAGNEEVDYSSEGVHQASVTQHLYPMMHSTLAHAGFDVVQPYVVHGLATADESARQSGIDGVENYITEMLQSPKYAYKHR